MAGTKRKVGGRSTAGQGYKKRRLVSRRRGKAVMARASRSLKPHMLSLTRMSCSVSPMSANSVGTTANFYQYKTVSLSAGFTDFASAGSILNNCTGIAEFRAMFDNYKLNAFKITFRPRWSNLNVNQGATAALTAGVETPYFCICKDPTHNSAITGTYGVTVLNTLLENGGKIYRADRPVTLYMRPKVSEQYGGGTNRYVSPQWTDLQTTSGIDAPHRGFHMMVYTQGFNAAALPLYQWDVYVTYYLQLKNIK